MRRSAVRFRAPAPEKHQVSPSDLDLDDGTVAISRSVVGRRNGAVAEKTTKTGHGRRIALDSGTVSAMKEHLQRCTDRAAACDATLSDDAYVFSPVAGGARAWRPDGITLAFGRLRRDLGLRQVRLHDLRHAAATQMLAAGVPVSIVAGRLGHASPATTLNVYGHWVRASDQAAAGALGALLDRSAKGDATVSRGTGTTGRAVRRREAAPERAGRPGQ